MSSPRRNFLRLRFTPPFGDAETLRDRIEALFSGKTGDAERVESSRFAKVFRFEAEVGRGTKVFYYKEFLFRNLRDRLSVLVRPSRAVRAWKGARILLDQGLDTATPVCVGEERLIGIVTRCFLVTEAVPDALEIEHYIREGFSDGGPERVSGKRKFISFFGETIGRMHRLGIFQGDLRGRNVLVQKTNPPRIFLIDNERTRIYRRLPGRKRLKNLVQANMTIHPLVTRTDRVRFFYAYLSENPDLRDGKRMWMRRILDRTRERLLSKGRLERKP